MPVLLPGNYVFNYGEPGLIVFLNNIPYRDSPVNIKPFPPPSATYSPR